MSTEQDIQVTIEENRGRAFVVLSGRLAPEFVTVELVTDMARKAGLAFDKGVAAQVDALVAKYTASPGEMKHELATATVPGDPVDGAIAWLPEFDPFKSRRWTRAGAPTITRVASW